MNLREYQLLVDAELDRLVPPETAPPETIHRAIRYSLFAGGKRIRPILCMEAARTLSGSLDQGGSAARDLVALMLFAAVAVGIAAWRVSRRE